MIGLRAGGILADCRDAEMYTDDKDDGSSEKSAFDVFDDDEWISI